MTSGIRPIKTAWTYIQAAVIVKEPGTITS